MPPPLSLHLQQDQHHSPPKSKNLPRSRAKKISARLSDVATELTELHHPLLDPSSSNREKLFTLTSIKAKIIPYICSDSVKISASTNNLYPISGENYVHKINEAKKKSETELNENWEKQGKSPYFKSIEHANAKTSQQQVSLNFNGTIQITTPASQKKKITPTLI